jgi:hypothetical protein
MSTPVEKTHAIYWKTTQDGEKPATISSMAIQTDIVDGTTPPALPSDFKEYNKSTRAGILTEFKTAVKPPTTAGGGAKRNTKRRGSNKRNTRRRRRF